MRLPRFSALVALAFAPVLLAACDAGEPDDPSATVEGKVVTELAADPNTGIGPTGRPSGATGRFTFYSLRDGAVVPNADSATTKWDLGFRASTIIANRTAGSLGGITVRVGAFQDAVVAPDTASAYGAQVSGAEWYDYANNLITPTAGRVLFVRTADGKYAKLRILSYYKGQTPSIDPTLGRYFTFEYVLQTDGSARFE